MSETAKTKLDEKTVVNTKSIAKMFNMTERNVRYLVEEGVISRVTHGRYDLIDTVSRYITFLKMSFDGIDESKVMESLDYEKWLHEKAKREKAEIELAHIKKEMHKADEVEKVQNHMVMAFRSKMLSLPSKVALQLVNKNDPKLIEAILERDIHEALSELAKYNPTQYFIEDDVEVEMVGDDDGSETNDEPVQ
ncbi:hypothetical protein J2D69_15935 [Lysinibacillus sphaericus]|uniref:Uncharacterized protein n=3 Tax=Lysinibacillus TaxID=400634 RepID=W7S1M7_LYSSH|nr:MULTISPECIES: hypothetical protein [Lysinibacillus]MBE5082962.1 hypothetical protein [Bacillus thuringiensis]ACA41247.1 conserved hypothetical protein [Lysinibacillus sphaericus C3-41]AMO32838.1 hypothetical protein AR327_10515 [Lysinibacillus sphaericus]AMR92058.1 hypothetical protein A1T07_18690 [Lysinibacillus sphaericus]ANA46106.1 hypothetical protein A2J09_11360 [Lysinibacillus sphaericus]